MSGKELQKLRTELDEAKCIIKILRDEKRLNRIAEECCQNGSGKKNCCKEAIEENTQLKLKLQKLEQDLKLLKNGPTKGECHQCDLYRMRNAMLMDQVKTLQHDQQLAEKDTQDVIEAEKTHLASLTRQNEKLQKQNEILQANATEMGPKLTEMTEENAELKKSLKACMDNIGELQLEHNQESRQKEELQRQIQILQAGMSKSMEMSQQVHEMGPKLKEMMEENAELKRSLRASEENIGEVELQHEQEVVKLQRKNQELTDLLTMESHKLDRIRNHDNEVSQKYERLSIENSQLKGEVSRLENANGQLKRDVVEKESQIHSLGSRLSQSRDLNDAANSMIQEAKTALKRSYSEKEELTRNLSIKASTAEADARESERAVLSAKMIMEEEVEKMKELCSENLSLKKRLHQMEMCIKEMEEDFKSKSMMLEHCHMSEFEKIKTQRDCEVSELSLELEKANHERREYEKCLKKMKGQLGDLFMERKICDRKGCAIINDLKCQLLDEKRKNTLLKNALDCCYAKNQALNIRDGMVCAENEALNIRDNIVCAENQALNMRDNMVCAENEALRRREKRIMCAAQRAAFIARMECECGERHEPSDVDFYC